ncbi:hypothetical protein ACIBQX_43630 [Nonomuraea sp. NPDC049714]|uniref:hypothetical protein n=1 Tax=Nonomuraea sp. NPDC049714 TaxID=3364357 RepID=UPI003798B620
MARRARDRRLAAYLLGVNELLILAAGAALAAAVRLLTLGGSPSSATRPAASSPSCSPPC